MCLAVSLRCAMPMTYIYWSTVLVLLNIVLLTLLFDEHTHLYAATNAHAFAQPCATQVILTLTTYILRPQQPPTSWRLWKPCSRARYSYASILIVSAVTICLQRKRYSQCTYSGCLCVSHSFVVTAQWFYNLVNKNVLTPPLRTLSLHAQSVPKHCVAKLSVDVLNDLSAAAVSAAPPLQYQLENWWQLQCCE